MQRAAGVHSAALHVAASMPFVQFLPHYLLPFILVSEGKSRQVTAWPYCMTQATNIAQTLK